MTVPAFPSPAEARREEGALRARDGLDLFWQRYRPEAPRATVAVLHGGGDHSGRYPGLTAALVRAGMEVALLDFRGHGRSGGARWHVMRFEEYLEDLEVFLERVRADAAGRRLFLVGHSQGGLIAARWGLDPMRPVAGVVLSSPWLRLAFEPPRLKVAVGRMVGKVWPSLPVPAGLDLAALTSDPEMQRDTDEDPLYGRKTTPRWFDEATRAQDEVRRRAGEFAHPLLVLLGEADPIADPAAGRAFCAAAASRDKQLLAYPGFRHEIYNEVGRERPVADTVAWISDRVTGSEAHGRKS
ncbi:MAG TPA: alpha/beta hydrolase [Anaeromyxobacteraceae bacterium]|nr:alpha/beta hydrolase [Anaeromyxobacteraceae bacterium]